MSDERAGVVVYGGGGHGRTLLDLLRAHDRYAAVAVVDDGDVGEDVLGVPVAGDHGALASLRDGGNRLAVNAIGPIGGTESRRTVFDRLDAAGFACPALVDTRAIVEPSASVAPGAQVLAGAYVGSAASIGAGAVVNTLSIVSHDVVIGALVHIAPGAMLAGEAEVGDDSLLGLGVTVHIGVRIGRGVRIGNSAVIKRDVPDGTVVRAGQVWPS